MRRGTHLLRRAIPCVVVIDEGGSPQADRLTGGYVNRPAFSTSRRVAGDSAARNRQAAVLEPNSCALSGVNVAVPFLFRQIAADGSVLNGNAPVFHVNSSPTAIFRDVVLQGCPVYGKRGAVFDANRPSKQI